MKREHIRICRGTEILNRTCVKCNEILKSIVARTAHELTCRGSVEANKSCRWCNKLLVSVEQRRTHERGCKSRPPGIKLNRLGQVVE